MLDYQFNPESKYWHKPKSFMLEVVELNLSLVAIGYKKAKEEIKAARKEKEREDKLSRDTDKVSTHADIMTTAEISRVNETDEAQNARTPSSKTIK